MLRGPWMWFLKVIQSDCYCNIQLSWAFGGEEVRLAVSLRPSSMFYSYPFDLKDGNANVSQE